MGLFDQIAGAISNPNQQASPNQLSSILGAVQQLSGNSGTASSTNQIAMSIVGNYVRSALQQRQSTGGVDQVEQIVDQYAGVGPNPDAVQAVFTPNQQSQVANDLSQRTGLSGGQVQGLLAIAVPIVLNMLQTGSTNQGGQGRNTVLSAFLDADRDGDVDMGDAMGMVGRFLGNQR